MSGPRARATWAGSILAGEITAGGYRVPGSQDVFFWTAAAGAAWSGAAWGGAVRLERALGGIVAVPDPAAGMVTVRAWWAYASALRLVRVDAAGRRIPVRGAPLSVTARTRRNNASVPRFRDGVDGVTATSGTLSPLTGLTGAALPRDITTGARVTAPSSGTATLRFDRDVLPPYPTTMGMFVRTSALASALRLDIDWYDLSSVLIASTSVAPASIAVSQAVGEFSWCTFAIAGPTGSQVTGQAGQARLTGTGLGAGGTLDVTGRLWEDGDLTGDFFDGDTLGGSWRGTSGASSSTLAPVVSILDAEAPLDVPLVYELTAGSAPGYAALTNPVELSVGQVLRSKRQTWMTHPGLGKAIRVWIEDDPTVTSPLERETFKVIGRKRKVSVSDTQRGGDEGDLTFITETEDEYNQLRAFLDDGSPLLLRMPHQLRHPPLWWLSFGDVTSGPPTRWARHPIRKVKADFVEVDRPSAATRPLVA